MSYSFFDNYGFEKRKPGLKIDDTQIDISCGGTVVGNVALSDPLSEMLYAEEVRLQKKVISLLPEKYQKTVELSLSGVKRKDIAERLGLKMSTIQNLKFRGLKKYQEIISMMDPVREF